MSNFNYTEEQKEAIFDKSPKMIVSASAGSGKTMVMINRIIDKVVNGRESLSSFLVVTFTNAAASEMKAKLVEALEGIENKDDFIKNELRDIASCNVCTLDSYCAKLLKTYFYEIDLDPAFIVIDAKEESALEDKAFERLFEETFESMGKEEFELLDIFSSNRKLDRLKEIILKTYRFFIVQPDIDDFFSRTYNEAYSENISKNSCIKLVNQFIWQRVSKLQSRCDALAKIKPLRNDEKLMEILSQINGNLLLFKAENDYVANMRAIKLMSKVRINKPAKRGQMELLTDEVAKLKQDYHKMVDDLQEMFDTDIDVLASINEGGKRAKQIFALTKRFAEIYGELKKESGALDFADLERFAMKLLGKDSVLSSIKQKIKYVFVDEYQDINMLQENILEKLEINGNVFLVGDVKQSIYAFRHCEPQIFLDKQAYFETLDDAKCVRLNHNFRSHKEILDFANAVFSRTMMAEFSGVNYAKDAMLVKGSNEISNPAGDNAVTVMEIVEDKDEKDTDEFEYYSVKNHKPDADEKFENGEIEGRLVANEILSLRNKFIFLPKSKTVKERRVKYSDITILVSSRDTALENLCNELKRSGIPYATDVDEDLFEDETMATLLNMLKIIDNRRLDYELIAVMTSKFFGFNFNELTKIKTSTANHRFFFECVEEYAKEQSDKLAEKVKTFYNDINLFVRLAQFMTVSDLICEIIKKYNLELIALESDEGEKTILKLSKLLESLSGKSYNDNLAKYIINRAYENTAFQNASDSDAVKITTIHKSKGLEYPIVFMPFISKNFNEQDFKSDILLDKKFGICVNNFDFESREKMVSLSMLASKINSRSELVKEKLRLFYVALTRPINYLYLIQKSSGEDYKIKDIKDAKSFADFLNVFTKDYEKNNGTIFTYQKIQKNSIIKLDTKIKTRDVIFSDNFAGFNNLKTKLENAFNFDYKYTKAINIPQKISVSELNKNEDENTYSYFSDDKSAANIGTAYHKLLSLLDLKNILNYKNQIEQIIKNGAISQDELSQVNLNEIYTLCENKEFIKLINESDIVLKEQPFFASFENREFFENGTDDKIIVFGICDVIIKSKNKIVILDYKTSRIKNESKLIAQYKKQLDIYKMAIGKSDNKKVESYIYSFALNKFIKIN